MVVSKRIVGRRASRQAFDCLAAVVLFLSGAEAQEEEGPAFDRRPYLQSLSSTSVLIVSQSERPSRAQIRYALEGGPESAEEEASPGNHHLFHLGSLEPAAIYRYQVSHRGEGDEVVFPEASFRTLPGPGGEVSVAAIGDSGTLGDAQRDIAAVLKELDPHLLLHTGDVVYPFGFAENYQLKFFEVYEGLLGRTCAYPTLGNHDCSVDRRYFLEAFHLPANNPAATEEYYSFDAGDAHFVALNTCTWDLPQEQVEWLSEDLAATDRIWKIVYFHHAPYSNGLHGGTVEVREAVAPVLDLRGVDLVLSGHDHVYERSYPIARGALHDGFQDPDYVEPAGTIYVVTGGGGAGLYRYIASPEAHLSAFFLAEHHALSLRITTDTIEGRAIGRERQVLDRFTIRKRQEPPALRFIRGDANQSGGVELSDAVVILHHLFLGKPGACAAGSDTDDSGAVLITDAIHLLLFLFQGGTPPPPPFPGCGARGDADSVGCLRQCQ